MLKKLKQLQARIEKEIKSLKSRHKLMLLALAQHIKKAEERADELVKSGNKKKAQDFIDNKFYMLYCLGSLGMLSKTLENEEYYVSYLRDLIADTSDTNSLIELHVHKIVHLIAIARQIFWSLEIGYAVIKRVVAIRTRMG